MAEKTQLVKALVQALIESEGLTPPFYGKITLHVQADTPTLVEFAFTRKLASPEHREPSQRGGSHGGASQLTGAV